MSTTPAGVTEYLSAKESVPGWFFDTERAAVPDGERTPDPPRGRHGFVGILPGDRSDPARLPDNKVCATWDTTFTADDLDRWVQDRPELERSYPFHLGRHVARRYTPKRVATPPDPSPEPSRWRKLLAR